MSWTTLSEDSKTLPAVRNAKLNVQKVYLVYSDVTFGHKTGIQVIFTNRLQISTFNISKKLCAAWINLSILLNAQMQIPNWHIQIFL